MRISENPSRVRAVWVAVLVVLVVGVVVGIFLFPGPLGEQANMLEDARVVVDRISVDPVDVSDMWIQLAGDEVKVAAAGETSLPPPPEDEEANHRMALGITVKARERYSAAGSFEVERFSLSQDGKRLRHHRWRRLNDPEMGTFDRYDVQSYLLTEDEPYLQTTLIVTPDGSWEIIDDVAYLLTDPQPNERSTEEFAGSDIPSIEYLQETRLSYRNAVVNGREAYLVTTSIRDGPTFTVAIDAKEFFSLGFVSGDPSGDDATGEHLFRFVSDEPLDPSLFVVPEGLQTAMARDGAEAFMIHVTKHGPFSPKTREP